MEWAAENTGENIRNAKFFSQKALIEILPVSYAEVCPEFGAFVLVFCLLDKKRKRKKWKTTNMLEYASKKQNYVNVTCILSLVGACFHPSSYADHVPLYKLSPMF